MKHFTPPVVKTVDRPAQNHYATCTEKQNKIPTATDRSAPKFNCEFEGSRADSLCLSCWF